MAGFDSFARRAIVLGPTLLFILSDNGDNLPASSHLVEARLFVEALVTREMLASLQVSTRLKPILRVRYTP